MSTVPSAITNADIVHYFETTTAEYNWLWGTHRHLGLHCGLVDAAHRSHDAAVLNTNRVLADAAGISAGMRVLDAGCGVGGSSIWLAEHRGAQVTGVNITSAQLDVAEKLVAERGLGDQVDFVCTDYADTRLPSASFDVVWALESFCYAHSKAAFVAEAWRLLKPGGRLVLADAFLTVDSLSAKHERIVHNWQRGWAVPKLISGQQMLSLLAEHGFKPACLEDKTAAVAASSNRMLRLFLCYSPFARVCYALGLVDELRWWGMQSGYYQYRARKLGLGIYALITATKPPLS